MHEISDGEREGDKSSAPVERAEQEDWMDVESSLDSMSWMDIDSISDIIME